MIEALLQLDHSGWEPAYDGLHTSQPEGNATISWNLSPSLPKSCSVPGGGTVASAAGDPSAHADGIKITAVACQTGSPEPGKVFTEAEKAQFKKQFESLKKAFATQCGLGLSKSGGPAYPLWVLRQYFHFFLPADLVNTCNYIVDFQVPTLKAMIYDPPGNSVSLVALPAVPAANGKAPPRCTYGARTCRRGGKLAVPYVRAQGQVTAAGDALATSLDRLGSTPAKPENLSANPPAYARRTQVAASRLYSGLLAAWCERLQAASTKFARFLRGLGGKSRIASKRMPPVLPAAPLWQNFHQMNVYELAQLTEDLISQQIQVPLDNYSRHHHSAKSRIAGLTRKLNAVHRSLESDLNAILAAKSQTARTTAANKFASDAERISGISGLARYAPKSKLTAQLLAFAAGALTTHNPKPVTAP